MDNVIKTKEKEEQQTMIIRCYRSSNNSPTILIAIPKEIREQYNLDKPASLYLIPKKDGFFLKKVDLEGIDE